MQIEKDELSCIKPLWEKLNKIHLKDSRHFKEYFRNKSYDERFTDLKKIDGDFLFIELVVDGTNPVGYCISSINNCIGEIESIYIEDSYRKFNLGRQLIDNAINWLKKSNCSDIQVAVADGHESVLGFYRKLGFYPKKTYLQLIK